MIYRNRHGRTLAAAFLMLAVLAGRAPQAGAESLTLACFAGAQGAAVSAMLAPWADLLEKAAGADLTIRRHWGGSLGRNPTKQFEMAKSGIADIAWVLPGYTPGQFPEASINELPFITRTPVEASLMLWRLYEKGMVSGLDEVKLLSIHGMDPYVIHARKPVNRFDDLNGLRIRGTGSVQADVLRVFGAVPVGIPTTETVEALNRGTLDAALLGWNGVRAFNMMGVIPYHFDAPLSWQAGFIVMNKRKWEGLEPKVRQVFEKYSGEWLSRFGGEGFERRLVVVRDSAVKDPGHTIVTPDEVEMKAAMARVMPLHRQWIDKTRNGQKVYDAARQILAELRAGK